MNGEWWNIKKSCLGYEAAFFAFDFDYNSEWDSITNKKYLLDSLDNSPFIIHNSRIIC